MTTKATSKPAEGGQTVRARIAADLERVYDEKIATFLDDALAAEKTVWAMCSKCTRQTSVVVPDWSARGRILQTLLDQGYGRPAGEDADSSVTLVVDMAWPLDSAEVARLVTEGPKDNVHGDATKETAAEVRAALIDAGWRPPPTKAAPKES